ncbi:hypothetical protein NIES2119_16655 [[Phormidium ambiguum] IAM M-71]|uniref:Uncharacterized protein n=1 Tax=[Phormidium ambiguum] IAM M-71 TaxID=454136 RepID=A0A1U7IHW3_9CYAN|nr:hypothetical protein NIES2119_16655 [Phormidium ambiguum IAM M-71]
MAISITKFNWVGFLPALWEKQLLPWWGWLFFLFEPRRHEEREGRRGVFLNRRGAENAEEEGRRRKL